jgi:hypothetical protein
MERHDRSSMILITFILTRRNLSTWSDTHCKCCYLQSQRSKSSKANWCDKDLSTYLSSTARQYDELTCLPGQYPSEPPLPSRSAGLGPPRIGSRPSCPARFSSGTNLGSTHQGSHRRATRSRWRLPILHALPPAWENCPHRDVERFASVDLEEEADVHILSGHLEIVFAGSVLWTEKIHRTELNRTAVRSFFRLRLPKFCVIPVAGCLI